MRYLQFLYGKTATNSKSSELVAYQIHTVLLDKSPVRIEWLKTNGYQIIVSNPFSISDFNINKYDIADHDIESHFQPLYHDVILTPILEGREQNMLLLKNVFEASFTFL